MTKAELIAAYAEATGQSKVAADEQIERLCDIVAAELLGGGEVTLPRLGKLKTFSRAARKGRNPKTGAAIDIPAKRAVKFYAGKSLRDSLS